MPILRRSALRRRGARRSVASLIGVAAAVVLAAGPASAHVEVEADPARTGSENASLSFSAEAESTTAGIVRVEIASPEGFDAMGVQLTSGPPGWTLTRTDRGFAVSGSAVAPGDDVTFVVRVRRLPDTPRSEFKVLQTYEDGRIDRWISLREPGQPEPDMPAALLTLEPDPTAATSSSRTPTSAEPNVTTQAPAAEKSSGDGWRWSLTGGVLGAVVVVGGGVAAVLRARRRRPPTP